ncbi:kynureninase [Metarhizobium album]|uniref:Kynureninase n=1 Tax=Metarhizobium album TaxID=2182425 RepID=A0A2U2DRA8_9HYPH|nr:kynureninase [Rhizobium album]PWE55844.1 kynureninase [Rhizobium album]
MTDLFERTKALFEIPEGVIYLDGNSLGPLARAAKERLAREVAENWGGQLIRAWNTAGWIDLPARIGNRIGALIGAPEGSVIAADSTSVNLFKALTAALSLTGERKVILSDSGNFPSDLYIAEGVIRTLDKGHRLKIVAPEEVEAAIDETVAVLMLTEVDYATGRLHDMKALTAKAKAAGVVTIWDLAHSAGALPVDLSGAGADFAIGCGYKYLNGGPGAPAFIYVRPELQDKIRPSLSGWLGHEAPFLFDLDYRPGPSIDRMRAGTPPILSMTALDAGLSAWDGVDIHAVRERSIALCDLFIKEVEARCPDLVLASPRDGSRRGSQVSFRHPQGYAVMQALIANNVIGDFRAPDIIRFGFTPLYIGFEETVAAAEVLEKVIKEKLWDCPEFLKKSKVT